MKQNYFLKTTSKLLILSLIFIQGINAQTYINEIYMQSSTTNQYIEFRGTPSSTIANGTYLVYLRSFASGAGRPAHVFDLSGYTFGSNGYLVLLQAGTPYVPNASATTITATGTAWGNLDSGTDDNMSDSSYSVLLITAPSAPVYNTDYDSNNDGNLEGVATNWTILDAIAYSNHTYEIGDFNSIYGGKAYFINSSGPGPTNSSGGTITNVPVVNAKYLARIGVSTGETSSDWLVGTTTGIIPSMSMHTTNVSPSIYGNETINTLGSENLDLTLGIEDVPLSNLKLYPNPTRDVFNIEFNSPTASEVSIYNINGQQVMKEYITDLKKQANINVSALTRGIYFVKIKDMNTRKEKSLKLVKY